MKRQLLETIKYLSQKINTEFANEHRKKWRKIFSWSFHNYFVRIQWNLHSNFFWHFSFFSDFEQKSFQVDCQNCILRDQRCFLNE